MKSAFLAGSIAIGSAAVLLQSVAWPQEMRKLDVAGLQSEMRSKICPVGKAKVSIPAQHEVCGGDGTRSPCGNDDRECHVRFVECARQFNEDRQVVIEYNNWLDTCQSRASPKTTPSVANAPVSNIPNTDVSSRLKAARQSAKDYASIAEAHEQKIRKEEAEIISEIRKEKEEVETRQRKVRENQKKIKAQMDVARQQEEFNRRESQPRLDLRGRQYVARPVPTFARPPSSSIRAIRPPPRGPSYSYQAAPKLPPPPIPRAAAGGARCGRVICR
jgi:hypothetical protein